MTPTTHYIGASHKVALCGSPKPILDLRPYNGEITCMACRTLRELGYSLIKPAPWIRSC
jgi:hypothetical protein